MTTTSDGGAGTRDRIVEAAVRLLNEQGPEAVQARGLAREVGASTMAVYHHFGGMPQLFASIADEGFRRLDIRLATVQATDDPVADIGGLALAYRATARENPHLYDLMFGLPTRENRRPEHDHATLTANACAAQRAYDHLVRAAERAIRAGRFREQNPAHIAAQLWSMLHGYVTLELSGHFGQFDGIAQVFVPMSINLLVGLGDAPERAARSASRAQQE